MGDMKGVLAVLDHRGEEVWYRVLSGPLSQVPVWRWDEA